MTALIELVSLALYSLHKAKGKAAKPITETVRLALVDGEQIWEPPSEYPVIPWEKCADILSQFVALRTTPESGDCVRDAVERLRYFREKCTRCIDGVLVRVRAGGNNTDVICHFCKGKGAV